MLIHQYVNGLSVSEALAPKRVGLNALCVLSFTGECAPSSEYGLINTGLKSLDANAHEVWWTDATVERGQSGRCSWSRTDEVLCVAIYLSPLEVASIEDATQKAYQELLQELKNQDYPYPFRFWNYMPNINAGAADDEVYKLFCSGRHQAFVAHGMSAHEFPSASALGQHADGAVFYVFAAKDRGQQVRNTLQVDAYDYPRQYGPKSPSFSRATYLKLEQGDMYMISGTASITGHNTIAKDDIRAQVSTTIANLKHLLDKPLERRSTQSGIEIKALKIYLRDAQDKAATQEILNAEWPNVQQLYLEADICRDDLLVEIECHCELPAIPTESLATSQAVLQASA